MQACRDLRQERSTCDSVNFLTDPSDGRSTLRPADVLVFRWVGEKHACVDLTRVSPLVRLGSQGFIVGQAALKATSCKVTKHEKVCIENQHVFILLAFDTFDFLAPEAVKLLNRVVEVLLKLLKFSDDVWFCFDAFVLFGFDLERYGDVNRLKLDESLHLKLDLPIQPVAPPSPDCIPGLEDPQTPPVPQDEDEREPMFVQAQDPDYVPEPIYPKYIPLEDEHEFPAEEQPLPPVDSPTAESPGYVTESDPEEDPEEYEDDETEDGPVNYPIDGGDDDDGDSSRDDANVEDEDDEDEEEEEEEHLAPADSAIVVPVDEPVFPPEGTEPVIPPPSTDITIGARITIRPQASISLPPEAEVERLLAMTTPSPSPPISLSPPSAGERLARCMALPAHSSPLLPSSGCPTQIQTLRITSTQALIDVVTAALPLPPSLYIPPPIDRRNDIPESELPSRKRLYLSTLGSRYEVGESSTARPTRGRGIDYGFVSTVDAEERRQGIRDVGYGIRDTWVDPAEAVPEIAPMTVGEVNTRVTELAELHEHDTQDLYALLEDAQDSRSRISQRVDMDTQRVDLLMGDRMTLQETVWMVEEEAYASREAWAHSIGLSQATHQELQTHRDHVYAHETHLQAHQTQLQLQSTLIQTQHQVHETRFQMQQAELAALRETDRRRQDQMVETLRVIRDMRQEMSDMQAELLALREQQRRARQPGPEARIPDHQDASGDADKYENKDIPRTGNFDDLCGNEPLRVPVEVVRKVIQNVNLLDSEGTISPYTSIDSRGIHGDPPDRSIKDWASPKTPTEIRQFLGLAVTIEGSLKDFRRLLRSEDFVVVLDAVTQRLRCGVNAA
ncbi:hypothetical protein Tco_1214985 [Tanacetum coccineum]